MTRIRSIAVLQSRDIGGTAAGRDDRGEPETDAGVRGPRGAGRRRRRPALAYAEFDAAVDRGPRAVRRGIEQGDRVGIWAPNCVEWMLVQYATARIGAVLVNINPAYRTHEVAFVLRQAGIGCWSPRRRSRPATTGR